MPDATPPPAGHPVRRILHLDMDAFYASVEQRDDPSLRGRPVAVGGSPEQRGVVAAASYEARAFGVRSAIPMSRALRLCPALAIVRPSFEKYRSISGRIFDLYRSVTPLVEPLSLDEAYLDVTDNAWGERLGVSVARRLKALIRESEGLTVSAGVAPNKFLAKIASGWNKPDGLTVIAPERVESFLQGLPVEALWGVGPVTSRRLAERGITTLMQVRTAGREVLQQAVGSQADWLLQLAHGIDERPVTTHREPKSAGTERTFPRDLDDLDTMRTHVSAMAEKASQWLDARGYVARTVTLKVRFGDFETVTRSHSDAPTRDAAAISARARLLLDRTEAHRRRVRLLGVSVHNLEAGTGTREPGQSNLPFQP
ncbi:MAG: DNA polymerase IV [Vicinamibacterales bacterium]